MDPQQVTYCQSRPTVSFTVPDGGQMRMVISRLTTESPKLDGAWQTEVQGFDHTGSGLMGRIFYSQHPELRRTTMPLSQDTYATPIDHNIMSPSQDNYGPTFMYRNRAPSRDNYNPPFSYRNRDYASPLFYQNRSPSQHSHGSRLNIVPSHPNYIPPPFSEKSAPSHLDYGPPVNMMPSHPNYSPPVSYHTMIGHESIYGRPTFIPPSMLRQAFPPPMQMIRLFNHETALLVPESIHEAATDSQPSENSKRIKLDKALVQKEVTKATTVGSAIHYTHRQMSIDNDDRMREHGSEEEHDGSFQSGVPDRAQSDPFSGGHRFRATEESQRLISTPQQGVEGRAELDPKRDLTLKAQGSFPGETAVVGAVVLLPSAVDDSKCARKKARVVTGPWTEDQDQQLRMAVPLFHARHWKEIAKLVPNRNAAQCLERWKRVLDPNVKKGEWSMEEDELLLSFVNQHEFDHWGNVSRILPGRSPRQCRERYNMHLDPRVIRRKWTKGEEDRLMEVFQQVGYRWSAIARKLPGRSNDQVKYRVRVLQQKQGQHPHSAGKNGDKNVGSTASSM